MQRFSITQFSGDTRYGPAVARVRVLEARLLPKHTFVRLAESPGWEALQEALHGTPFAEPLADVRRTDQLDAAFARIEAHRGRLIRSLVLDAGLSDALAEWPRFSALKDRLRVQLAGEAPRELSGIGASGNRGEPIPSRSKALNRARVAAEADYARHHSLFRLDAVVDRALQEHVLAAFEASDLPFLRHLARYGIDLSNLTLVLRRRVWREAARRPADRPERMDLHLAATGGFLHAGILASLAEEPWEHLPGLLRHTPYGDLLAEVVEVYRQRGSLGLLEIRSDEFLSAFCRLTTYTPFGVEPIVAFGWCAQQEFLNFMTVARAKAAGLRSDVVIPRLRGGYHA